MTAVDRGRYRCLADPGTDRERAVTAMRARELGRKGVVVGDRVALVGDVSGDQDTLARIVRVEPRTSALRRTADDTDPFERIIVANADRLVIVTALAHPEPRPRMIDRQLVAAYDAGMDPLLCLTKADLADPDGLIAEYAPLGVPYVVTRRGGDLGELREHLSGRTSVLVGHSGVGKSTLVNALVPDAERAVSHVNAVTGRGGTPPRRRSRWSCPAGTAGSSTPPACGASAWRTSIRSTCSTRSRTSPRAPPNAARRTATTSRRTAA